MQYLLNLKKIISYSNLVNQASSQLNKNEIKKQGPYSQIENDD